MTRSREAITERSLKNLRRLATSAKGNQRALEELLVRELSGWEEADSGDLSDAKTRHKAINKAVQNLGCTVGCCDSMAHYRFQQYWGASSDKFPHHWHAFVNSFMTDMMDEKDGIKVILNLNIKFGFSTLSDADMSDEAKEQRASIASLALEEFKKEADFWSVNNLCHLFINYLATLYESGGFNVTHFDEQVRHLRNIVINSLLHILDVNEEALYTQFDEQTKMLKLIFSHQAAHMHCSQEDNETYKNVKAIYDIWQPAREEKERLRYGEYDDFIIEEWKRINQLTTKACTDTRLFEKYVAIIDELYSEWTSLVNASVLPKWNNLPYMLGGAGVGAIVGGAIVIGLIVAGALTACAPAVFAAIFIIAGVALVASLAGYAYKKYRDMDSPEALAAEVETIANPAAQEPSFRQIFTTAVCTLVVGFTLPAFCNAATDSLASEQQSSQDDQDDATDEVELSSIPSSGKRFG